MQRASIWAYLCFLFFCAISLAEEPIAIYKQQPVSTEDDNSALAQINAPPWKMPFYGLKDKEFIGGYYNGEKGSLGSGPGPNDGITYSPNAQVLHSVLRGGSGNFTGDPGELPVMFLNSSSGTYFNVPAGFTTGIAFHYSAAYFPGAVSVWSGMNGTGTLLATLQLPSNGACMTGPVFCNWTAVGVVFTGTAKSVSFNGRVNQIGFASVKAGTAKP